jgi:8-oxo-dGTP diphosphatase
VGGAHCGASGAPEAWRLLVTGLLSTSGGQGLLRRLAPIWRALPAWLQWALMWLGTAKFSLGVTGIVFDGEGRVLLLRHTFRRRYPWGLVSGWVKRGEALEDALLREVVEETALRVRVGPLFQVRRDRLRLAVEAVYLCRLEGGEFRPSNEVTAIQWRRPDDLPAGLHPHHFPLIREAARRMAPS